MANIDDELLTIRDAGKGEDVRAAIISAIKKIHNEKEYPPTATKFVTNGVFEGGPWNKVEVAVPEGGADINNIDDMSQKPITENDYYTIPKLIAMGFIPNEECIGINGFTVDVHQTGDLGEINITENGVYDPLLDGYDGYSKVYVNVLGGGNPGDTLRIRFFDSDGKLLDQQNVAYGSDFAYRGKTPTSGGTFLGWNPSVQRVTNSQDFHAVYSSGGGLPGEIVDPWPTIVNKMRAKQKAYNIGDWKGLQIGTQIVQMTLIGYEIPGETTASGGQAFSTWIGGIKVNKTENVILPFNWYMNSLPYPSQGATYINQYYWQKLKDSNYSVPVWPTWGNSLMRAHLNGDDSKIAVKYPLVDTYSDQEVYNNLAGQHVPDLIKAGLNGYDLVSALTSVKKYSSSRRFTNPINDRTIGAFMEETVDKIWLPSFREYGKTNTQAVVNKGPVDYNTRGVNLYAIILRELVTYGNDNGAAWGSACNPADTGYYYCNDQMYTVFGTNTSAPIGFCI